MPSGPRLGTGSTNDARLVWYVSYGSNLLRDRFLCYLMGGTASGANKPNPGARRREPPRAARPVTLPYEVYFAERSRSFGGGGVAFLDHGRSDDIATLGRRYLITIDQMEDVVAQECWCPTRPIDLDRLRPGSTLTMGRRRYDALMHLGLAPDGRAMLTCTSPTSMDPAEVAAPAERYLRLIARGVQETHGLASDEVSGYLAARPGVAGRLDPAVLDAVTDSL
jgi:hypothetical protein